jgi:hypothetical protein
LSDAAGAPRYGSAAEGRGNGLAELAGSTLQSGGLHEKYAGTGTLHEKTTGQYFGRQVNLRPDSGDASAT